MSTAPRIIPVGHELPAMEGGKQTTGSRSGGKHGKHTRKRSGGRWASLNRFVDVMARTLNPLAVAVWLQLFRHAMPNGLVCLSQTELARRVGRSVRSVHSALKRLEAAGVLTVVRRGSLRAGPSTYRVYSERKNDR